MPLQTITGPSSEPVTLAETKTLLRVDGSDEDALLSALIKTARVTVENQTRRALMNQTLELALDRWPAARQLIMPRPPLASVTSVSIIDTADIAVVWDVSQYIVETTGPTPRIVLLPGAVWPALTRPAGGIRIRYVAGYGDIATDVPPPLAHAVLLLVAHWFENRVPVVLDAPASQVPGTVNALIAEYRLPRL